MKEKLTVRPGIGKTSLIRSLAQRCEHIVHVDQIEPNQTRDVAETYASSRPHPWWKTDSQLLLPDTQRPSSMTGEMLDRNVCFVEGPGHMNGPSVRSSCSHFNKALLTNNPPRALGTTYAM